LSILLCGVGNIGSNLIGFVPRLSGISKLVIIDRDVYTAANAAGQAITARDVGRPKAQVAARRAQAITDSIAGSQPTPATGGRRYVVPIYADLRYVPPGVFRDADLVIGCLDSQRSRVDLATHAWRAGKPLIDTGVNAELALARVSVFVPIEDGPCYCCGIDDWSQVGATLACGADEPQAPATHASAYLGAAAACLAMSEVTRAIERGLGPGDTGREIILDLNTNRLVTTRNVRRPDCPFDHRPWRVCAELSVSCRLGEALELATNIAGEPAAISVDGQTFVRNLTCSACGQGNRKVFRLAGRLRKAETRCPGCGHELVAAGMDLIEALNAAVVSQAERRCSLRRLGLTGGDILMVSGVSGQPHFQLGVVT